VKHTIQDPHFLRPSQLPALPKLSMKSNSGLNGNEPRLLTLVAVFLDPTFTVPPETTPLILAANSAHRLRFVAENSSGKQLIHSLGVDPKNSKGQSGHWLNCIFFVKKKKNP